MSAPESVRVAVIGAGGWGRNHVRTFAGLRGAELVYVCDKDPNAREAVARAHPGVKTTDDLGAVLRDATVRGVVIATDAPSHHEIALAALRAGKDLLVEKPLTLSHATSDELCREAEARARVLTVGHLLLFHPAVERLRSLIDQGELGEVLYVYCQRLNLGVVRRDENAWWSLAPHDVSLVHHLLGAEANAVSASGGTFLQRDRNIEDVVFATLDFPDKRIAHVHVSWLDPHKTRRLTVVGSKRMAVFDDGSPDQKLTLFDKGAEPPPAALSYAEGVRVRTGDITVPALRMTEPLAREAESFVEAIRTRKVRTADGRSGAAVVRVLEAGHRSLREGGRRVSTNESS